MKRIFMYVVLGTLVFTSIWMECRYCTPDWISAR